MGLGRQCCKQWGCLFTCLISRAIHLEVLATLDASELFMAITRFMSLCGATPKLLRSDNGTNMMRAHKEIVNAARKWDSGNSCQTNLAVCRIEWHFMY